MRNILKIPSVVLLALTGVVSSVFAVPDSVEPLSSAVLVIDGSKETVFYSNPGESISDFLSKKNIDVKKYKNADNTDISASEVFLPGQLTTISKVESAYSTKEVSIPFATKKEKTDDLYVGETKVATEGKNGKAIETTVTKGSHPVISVSVVDNPVSKVILVGTKEREKEETVSRSRIVPNVSRSRIGTDKSPHDTPLLDSFFNESNSDLRQIVESNKGNRKIEFLAKQVGKPYVWGTQGPDTFDCSGLVYAMLRDSGKNVDRTTAAGYGAMSTPISVSELAPGDILYNDRHIAVYVGFGKVIHAANRRVGIVVGNVNTQLKRGLKPGRLNF